MEHFQYNSAFAELSFDANMNFERLHTHTIELYVACRYTCMMYIHSGRVVAESVSNNGVYALFRIVITV